LTLEETAEILLNNNISGVPVVDAAGALLGTIDKDELFAALVALSGLSHKGHLFAFELEDRAGSIKEVSDIIRKYGGRLVSVVSSYETAPEGKRHVYVRAFGLDPVSAGELEEELKNAAHLLYVVDHQEGRRKFF
jgi:acetoin utilization protein AcuB